MIGSRIANYLIQDKLGEGGMGLVFRAVDLNLDRPVAIKVLGPELARSSQFVARFRHEAKALANLNHVNIATLYTFIDADGQYLMVMEYLEGDTFDSLIRKLHRIQWTDAICWTKQALLGIGFAHHHNIIHRDIKPSNLMLTRSGIVKVMDFGIAKVLGAQGITGTSSHLGTVAYMSPEQIRNSPLDTRTDIYSLSVTLFQMLTGRLPFLGADFDMMSAHLNTPPPRLIPFCPELPCELEEAVLRGMAKNAAARYQCAEEFGAALDQVERHAQRIGPPHVVPAPQPNLGAVNSARAAPRPSPPRLQSPVAPPQFSPRIHSPAASPPSPPRIQYRAAPSPPRRSPSTSSRRARNRGFVSLCIGVAIFALLIYAGCRLENVGPFLACAVLLYFFPILIAAISRKRNGPTVVRLNTLRGWTGVGWIEAMKHALADDD